MIKANKEKIREQSALKNEKFRAEKQKNEEKADLKREMGDHKRAKIEAQVEKAEVEFRLKSTLISNKSVAKTEVINAKTKILQAKVNYTRIQEEKTKAAWHAKETALIIAGKNIALTRKAEIEEARAVTEHARLKESIRLDIEAAFKRRAEKRAEMDLQLREEEAASKKDREERDAVLRSLKTTKYNEAKSKLLCLQLELERKTLEFEQEQWKADLKLELERKTLEYEHRLKTLEITQRKEEEQATMKTKIAIQEEVLNNFKLLKITIKT